jgi:galactose mutarotase-like enzyme
MNNNFFNIIDGFLTPEELLHNPGAKSWIMASFANRIPEGKYFFNGIEHRLKPMPPEKEVIHGFAAYKNL